MDRVSDRSIILDFITPTQKSKEREAQSGLRAVQTMVCSTTQHSAVQYGSVQCNAVNYGSAGQCSTVQFGILQCNAVQYSAMQYCTERHSAVSICRVSIGNQIDLLGNLITPGGTQLGEKEGNKSRNDDNDNNNDRSRKDLLFPATPSCNMVQKSIMHQQLIIPIQYLHRDSWLF